MLKILLSDGVKIDADSDDPDSNGMQREFDKDPDEDITQPILDETGFEDEIDALCARDNITRFDALHVVMKKNEMDSDSNSNSDSNSDSNDDLDLDSNDDLDLDLDDGLDDDVRN